MDDDVLLGGTLELLPAEVIGRMSTGRHSAAAMDGMAALLAELLADGALVGDR